MARTNSVVALTTDEVSITTAGVTIKAIQVGRKQMTQSVFRQLPAAPLVDEIGVKLLGIPWGWVNYHWADVPPGRHFIFQQGGQLFRCSYPVRVSEQFGRKSLVDVPLRTAYRWCPDGFSRFVVASEREAVAYHLARILEGWRPRDSDGREWDRRAAEWYSDYPFGEPPLGLDRIDFYIPYGGPTFPNVAALGRLMLAGKDGREDPIWGRQRMDAARATEDALREEIARRCGAVLSSDQIESRFDVINDSARDYCRRWDELMGRLSGVEQLFIAC